MVPLLWLDLETTNLDPRHGHIVEAAWFVGSENLDNETGIRTTLVDAPSRALKKAPPEVQTMHRESGLWDLWHGTAAAEKLRPAELGAAILRDLAPWHKTYREDAALRQKLPRFVYLAGSNADFERRWLERHVPAVARLLSHRALDVSRIRTAFEFWTSARYIGSPAAKHRAKDDLLDHWTEAAFYRSMMEAVSRPVMS